MRTPCFPYSGPQGLNVLDQHSRGSIRERHGEEKRSTCDEIPTVPHHASMLTPTTLLDPGFR
jgi:hypothetical protein